MKIVFVSSEVVPFSKTGGLADVAGALPAELRKRGHAVWVFTPLYKAVREKHPALADTGASVHIPLGGETVEGRVMRLDGAGDETVFFVDAPPLFDRDGLYQEAGKDHADNADRFAFFARAVLESLDPLGLEPDLFHVHDWQASLLPVYLDTLYSDASFSKAGTLLTIHNLGYQGLFPEEEWEVTGLPRSLFDWRFLEFFGKVNFLKGGIVHAGAINTVSRTYAREIQTPEYGAGLDGVLRERASDLFGVVNGIDTEVWNPETDPLIPSRFGLLDLDGKEACKRALLEEAGLGGGAMPLFGMITRLAPQKGVDLLAENIDALVSLGLGLVVLGTGDPIYHEMLEEAEKKHPDRVRAFLSFDNGLAHRIEAGADVFLMPSRYEPCGLNQLMSLRYGTVPVVRRTGGLADTVVDATPENLEAGKATGFCFDEATGEALIEACGRAVKAYGDGALWDRIRLRGMARDWSWRRAAGEYERLYERVIEKRRARV